MDENYLKTLDDQELMLIFSKLKKELKDRNIIRTNNIIGEIGEYLAIQYYNSTPGLPKLSPASISTKSVDALGKNGERYTIKTITKGTTGVFHGIDDINNKLFEKLIIVELDDNYLLKRIIEVDWNTFFKYKSWHSTMNAYNIRVTSKLLNDSKIIYSI